MCPRQPPSRARRSRLTCAAVSVRRASSRSRSTTRRHEPLTASESYPAELKYHPEHDWARIDGDEATFGITWFAQDALGELVHFEPPEEGATVTAGQPYAEVESVKAVSDVVAPLSGEIVEINRAIVDAP